MVKEDYLNIVNNLNDYNIIALLKNYALDNNKTLTDEMIHKFNNNGLLRDAIDIAIAYYDNKFTITNLQTTKKLLKW